MVADLASNFQALFVADVNKLHSAARVTTWIEGSHVPSIRPSCGREQSSYAYSK